MSALALHFLAVMLVWGILFAPPVALAQTQAQEKALLEARRLHDEAFALASDGKFSQGVPLVEQALAIHERVLGPEHPQVAITVAGLAVLYKLQGQYAQAEPLLNRALDIQGKAFGLEHPNFAVILNLLAEVYREQSHYARAEPLYKQALAIWEKVMDPEAATGLNNLASLYVDQGQYARAEPLYKRALEIMEPVLGSEHLRVATAINNLAHLYEKQSRYSEAEKLYLRAFAIFEKTLGSEHPTVAAGLNNLGHLYLTQGQYDRAAAMLERALKLREVILAPDHPDLALSLNNLAALYNDQGRYDRAAALHQRSLAIREKSLGTEHPDVAQSLSHLAAIYREQGQYARAEPLYQRTRAILEKALGVGHPRVAMALNNLALLYENRGNHGRAEPLYRRALAIEEKALGPEHPQLALTLNNLAEVYRKAGQYTRAAALYQRSLDITEKALGPEHVNVALRLNNLAALYSDQGQFERAEVLHKRALAIREKTLGPDHPDVASSLNSLAALYADQLQYDRAEPLYQRSLALREKALGRGHPDVAQSLNNLAIAYRGRGEYARAESLYREALSIWEKVLGPTHSEVAIGVENLAVIQHQQGQLAAARSNYERSRRIRLGQIRTEIDDETVGGLQQVGRGGLLHYVSLLSSISRSPQLDEGSGSAFRDAFMVLEQTKIGLTHSALAKASVRAATGEVATAVLARNVQDLRNRRQALGKRLDTEYSKPAGQYSSEVVQDLQQARQTLDNELLSALEKLNGAFPKYAELSSPEPIDIASAQKLLGAGEALVSYLTLNDRLLIWVVRKEQEPIYRDIKLKKAELQKLVSRVRASLDQAQNPELTTNSLLAPFDVAGSHQLFQVLFSELKEHLGGVKHFIVVPDEVLLPVPFGALITNSEGEPYQKLTELHNRGKMLDPRDQSLTEYAKLPWLIRDYAVTVLPSATSLRALRQIPRTQQKETELLIAFGDPVLEGNGLLRGGPMLAARGTLVPVEDIRKMNRLPGTRDELQAVAKALGASPHTSLYLGQQATEPMVTKLNSSGRLAKAEVVAFSTHGLIAGELKGLREPALVLTPPKESSEEDDGLLGLEDILKLKLDSADWVILSACNTAAADGSGEGLSGLVRAFFFAGARSLLVSHWSVEDQATQTLMTEIFQRYAKDKTMSRSEALRQGMLALMEKAKDETAYFAHPFSWAPFFLVGEGR
jgi:CHAT domain-containing protein/Tfp pilus assembly protein PilF